MLGLRVRVRLRFRLGFGSGSRLRFRRELGVGIARPVMMASRGCVTDVTGKKRQNCVASHLSALIRLPFSPDTICTVICWSPLMADSRTLQGRHPKLHRHPPNTTQHMPRPRRSAALPIKHYAQTLTLSCRKTVIRFVIRKKVAVYFTQQP